MISIFFVNQSIFLLIFTNQIMTHVQTKVSMSSIYLALTFQMGERQKNSAEVQVPNKMLFDPAENCQFLALLNNT